MRSPVFSGGSKRAAYRAEIEAAIDEVKGYRSTAWFQAAKDANTLRGASADCETSSFDGVVRWLQPTGDGFKRAGAAGPRRSEAYPGSGPESPRGCTP